MTQQPPPPGPGFGPPPPQYAPTPPAPPPYVAPQQPPYAQPPYAQAPQQPPYAQAPPQPAAEGPDFLAVDKRNAVVVDASGVAFESSGLSIEFRWPEIRSVHYQASPSGKALMVAVIHMDGRFFECVVEAKPRSRLQEWFPQLAWVLGHYRPAG
ncbi:hypothetical protein AB0I06_10435 [Streptomyces sp. NPDC050674]|uniref:hypothetical protein n=1 Tax=Streptomyces sp. NPDC050674 TaxID=3157216 RepID=UPI00342A82DF